MREHGRADDEIKAMASRDLEMESRRRCVQRVGRRHRRTGLVLDPDRAQIHRELARVIRGVVLADELCDAPILSDDVVRRQDARGIFEAPHGAFEHHDRPVVDDELDDVAVAAHRVVALWDGAAPLDPHEDLTRGAGRVMSGRDADERYLKAE
ncbi:MAG: hypothetical protein M3O80_06735 [Chloroflexota bacterium]|nr:hypothetical protein [Chloroflexota bacterium]